MDEKIKSNAKDVAYALAKAGISQIPIVGAVAYELVGLIVSPSMEKRKTEWMTEIGERLRVLESTKSLKLEDLANNDQFIDTVAQATSLALKTSNQEKLAAFKNAVLNTALPDSPDKTLTQIFLNLIDRFTGWHIKILQLFDDPEHWFRVHDRRPPTMTMGSLSYIVTAAYPELNDQPDLLNLIWNDLHSAGLHNSSALATTMTGHGLLQPRLTTIGRQFLQFISEKE